MILPYYVYLIFTYIPSFTDYEDDIFEVFFSNLHIQGSKFGRKIYKFGGKSKKKVELHKFMEFVFSRSSMRGLGTDHVISGPMRGLKKLHPMAQTDRQTHTYTHGHD